MPMGAIEESNVGDRRVGEQSVPDDEYVVLLAAPGKQAVEGCAVGAFVSIFYIIIVYHAQGTYRSDDIRCISNFRDSVSSVYHPAFHVVHVGGGTDMVGKTYFLSRENIAENVAIGGIQSLFVIRQVDGLSLFNPDSLDK